VAQVIVLDANTVISALEKSDPNHAEASALLESRAGEQWAISVLTLAEVLVHPAARGRLAESVELINGLGLTVHPVDASAAARLATVRAQTGLRMPDAVVFHLAQGLAAHLVTFDKRLANRAREAGISVIGPEAR
jgi:predicted nucleic acid-binding protein